VITRAVGAILIIAACALLGAARAAELKNRSRRLASLCSALELMRGEVVNRLAPMPEIAERLAAGGPDEVRGFFRRISAEMGGLGEKAFSEIWADCAGELGLRQDETAALCDLGRSLGRYGADEQEAAIARCMSRLGAFADDARAEAAAGARLYGGLGITAGLLLAVMLI
jgi:stage III sporulation protein AB